MKHKRKVEHVNDSKHGKKKIETKKKKNLLVILKLILLILAVLIIIVGSIYVGTNAYIYSKISKVEAGSTLQYTSYFPKIMLSNKILNAAKINNIYLEVKYFKDKVVIAPESINNFMDINVNVEKKKFDNIPEIAECNALYIEQSNFSKIITSDLFNLSKHSHLDIYTLHEDSKIEAHDLGTKVENETITINASDKPNLGYIIVYVETKDIIVKDVIDGVIHIGNGNSKSLEVELVPSNATNNGITFTSNDDNIAKIEETNLVGVNLGDNSLLVQNGEFNKTIGVHVANYVTSIILSTDNITLNPNNTYEITYSIVPEDAENKEVVFEVADQSIISIEGNVIKALKVGNTNVTIKTTSGNIVEANLTVNVVKKYVAKKNTTTKVTYINGILIANKTYALPSSYNPGGLTSETLSAFNSMKSAAAKEGINLWISSGFRSYATQDRLYNNYVANYGKASADTFSARPGHSEHQTGLAMDVNYIEDWFGNTKEGKWLAENCHKYGFIIRYPKGKESITGYKYEPWHIRYLGVDVATAVYNSGLCLEEYLNITSRYTGE